FCHIGTSCLVSWRGGSSSCPEPCGMFMGTCCVARHIQLRNYNLQNSRLAGPEQSRNNKLNLYQDQVCSGLEKRGPSKSGSTKEEPAYVRFDCSQVLGQKFRISRTQGKRPRVSCCQSATQPTTEQQGDGTPPSIFRAPLRLSFCCQSFTTEMNLRSKKMQLFRFVEQTYTSQN